MKVTPIISNILLNAFAVVGFVSVVMILSMKLIIKDEPKLSCINNRVFDFISAHYADGEKLELIRYNSGMSDKMNVFVLYKRKDRVNGCVLHGKQIAMEVLDGEAGEKQKKFPDQITISRNEIKISYRESMRANIDDLPVIWNIKSKLAAVH